MAATITIRRMTAPMILMAIWTKATRRALLLAPMLEIREVTQVPIFWPMTMGAAMAKVMEPVRDSACKMPTDAAEL